MVSLTLYRKPFLNMAPSDFQSKITKAKDLDFGTIINQAIELFKKSWLQGFMLQLFVMLMVIPLFLMIYMPIVMAVLSGVGTADFDPDDMQNTIFGLSTLYVIMIIIGVIAIGVVQIALVAGFYRILRNLDAGREAKTSDLFYFLKKDHLNKMLLLLLAMVLIAVPAALLLYLPLIYVMVPLSFFPVVFAFNPSWRIGEIVSSSFRLGNKKWLLTFGLLIITYMATAVLSFLTCGLGGLFFSSFMYHPVYIIYKEVIGFDDLNELDQIGKAVTF